jgi:hypothetical protein
LGALVERRNSLAPTTATIAHHHPPPSIHHPPSPTIAHHHPPSPTIAHHRPPPTLLAQLRLPLMASHGKRSIPTTAKLRETARGIDQSHTIQLESHKELRRLFKFSFNFHEAQITTSAKSPSAMGKANWRTMRERTAYATALAKSCHFFVVFALCVSRRTSSEKAVIEFLEGVGQDTSSYQFTLNEETITLFRNWATADNYAAAPAFVNFINSIGSRVEPYSLADLEIVKRMLAARGLEGAPEAVQVMRIMFPNRMAPNVDHFRR